MSEKKNVKETKEWICEELDKCKDKVDVTKLFLRTYVSMYATYPKQARDMLNDIEDKIKTKAVNFSIENNYVED